MASENPQTPPILFAREAFWRAVEKYQADAIVADVRSAVLIDEAYARAVETGGAENQAIYTALELRMPVRGLWLSVFPIWTQHPNGRRQILYNGPQTAPETAAALWCERLRLPWEWAAPQALATCRLWEMSYAAPGVEMIEDPLDHDSPRYLAVWEEMSPPGHPRFLLPELSDGTDIASWRKRFMRRGTLMLRKEMERREASYVGHTLQSRYSDSAAEWLVRMHLGGERAFSIAKMIHEKSEGTRRGQAKAPNDRNVSTQAKAFAKLIGLPFNPKRGRPVKNPTSS